MARMKLVGMSIDFDRMRSELKVVPPCRDCGSVPKQYVRGDRVTISRKAK